MKSKDAYIRKSQRRYPTFEKKTVKNTVFSTPMRPLIVKHMIETDAVASMMIIFVARQVYEACKKYLDEIRDDDKTSISSDYEEDVHDWTPNKRKEEPKRKKVKVE